MDDTHWARRTHRRVGVRRLAGTGAVVLPAMFVASWLAAQLPASTAPTFFRMFAYPGAASAHALIEGLVWSSLLGLGIGFLVAITYNALGELDEVPDLFAADESLNEVPNRSDPTPGWREDKHIGVAEALSIVEEREKRRMNPALPRNKRSPRITGNS